MGVKFLERAGAASSLDRSRHALRQQQPPGKDVPVPGVGDHINVLAEEIALDDASVHVGPSQQPSTVSLFLLAELRYDPVLFHLLPQVGEFRRRLRVVCRPFPAIVVLLDLYIGYPFATGFLSRSSVRQQYQLATEA
jgi:hypothetical protein